MRKSSKVLAIVFLLVAGGLVFWSTKRDSTEIEAAVEARVEQATADRRQEIENEFAERKRVLEEEYAEREREIEEEYAARERAQQDSLVQWRVGLAERMAALDSARAALENPVYFRLNAAEVAQVLRGMGLDYTQGTDDDGDPKFEFKLATYNVVLYFYGCEDEGCTSLRIYAGFDTTPSQEKILEWGRNKRYATAYLNNDGKARLDSDLIIKGGITLGALEAFILNFRDRVDEFADHIDF